MTASAPATARPRPRPRPPPQELPVMETWDWLAESEGAWCPFVGCDTIVCHGGEFVLGSEAVGDADE